MPAPLPSYDPQDGGPIDIGPDPGDETREKKQKTKKKVEITPYHLFIFNRCKFHTLDYKTIRLCITLLVKTVQLIVCGGVY